MYKKPTQPDDTFWRLEVNINPGKLDDFIAVVDDLCRTMDGEAGTLGYGYFLNDDKTVCHIHEHYRDSEGLIAHATNFGNVFAERFMAACTPTSLILYGTPNAEAKAIMQQYGAVYFTKIEHYSKAHSIATGTAKILLSLALALSCSLSILSAPAWSATQMEPGSLNDAQHSAPNSETSHKETELEKSGDARDKVFPPGGQSASIPANEWVLTRLPAFRPLQARSSSFRATFLTLKYLPRKNKDELRLASSSALCVIEGSLC